MENGINLLTKKRSKRNRLAKKYDIAVNMKHFTNNVMKELLETKSEERRMNLDYQTHFNQYKEEYSLHFRSILILRIIQEYSLLPVSIILSQDFHKKMSDMADKLLMTPFELVYLTLILDELDWDTPGMSVDDNLLMAGLLVKQNTVEGHIYHMIQDHVIATDKQIEQKYMYWYQLKCTKINHLQISYKQVSQRFRTLSRSFNILCQKDVVGLNFIVDQILQSTNKYQIKSRKRMRFKEGKLRKLIFPLFKVIHTDNDHREEDSQIKSRTEIAMQDFGQKGELIYTNQSQQEKIKTWCRMTPAFKNALRQNIKISPATLIHPSDDSHLKKEPSNPPNITTNVEKFSSEISNFMGNNITSPYFYIPSRQVSAQIKMNCEYPEEIVSNPPIQPTLFSIGRYPSYQNSEETRSFYMNPQRGENSINLQIGSSSGLTLGQQCVEALPNPQQGIDQKIKKDNS